MEKQMYVLQTTLPDLTAKMTAFNNTLAKLDLARFVSQVDSLNRAVSLASDQTAVLQGSVRDLLPRVGSIERMISQMTAYNASVYSGLQAWSANFRSGARCVS